MAKKTKAQKKADKRRRAEEANARECHDPSIETYLNQGWEEEELELHGKDTLEHVLLKERIAAREAQQHL